MDKLAAGRCYFGDHIEWENRSDKSYRSYRTYILKPMGRRAGRLGTGPWKSRLDFQWRYSPRDGRWFLVLFAQGLVNGIGRV